MPNKRVLIGCEKSGIVRDAFAALGYDAWSCDLEPSDRPGQHYQCDLLEVLDDSWHLFIGHPPCTYLSVSGLHWNKRRPERAALTEQALDFVRRLMAAPIKYVAIENPVSCISSRIRKPDQIIQPFDYGHDASKKTCLWLKNLPLLVPTQYIKPRMVCKCGRVYAYDWAFTFGCDECGPGCAKPRWGNQTDSGNNRVPGGPRQNVLRAETYRGVANAFAQQWSAVLCS